jgi:methionyl-tRNA formyltransferase
MVAGRIDYRPNDLSLGSYFGARQPEDGRIDWSQPAQRVYDLIRAVAPPYPGAFTDVAGVRLVVASARRAGPTLRLPAAAAPGLHVVDGHVVALCGDGGLIWVRELRADGAPLAPEALTTLLQRQHVPEPTR